MTFVTQQQEPHSTNRPGPLGATANPPLVGEPGAGSARTAANETDREVDAQLLETAAIVFAQLQMIRECSPVDRPSGAIVVAIVERAESLAVSSPEAIGAIGVIVGATRFDDDARLAHVLETIRSTFDADELLRAAAALLDASTAALADVIGTAHAARSDVLHGALGRLGRNGRSRRFCRRGSFART